MESQQHEPIWGEAFAYDCLKAGTSIEQVRKELRISSIQQDRPDVTEDAIRAALLRIQREGDQVK